MIITLSGVTGSGKSYFKKRIQEKLGLNNQIIYTTRPIRVGEKAGVDKIFITNEEFDRLKCEGKIIITFEFLGHKYGYSKEKLKSDKNSIIELHYTIIHKFKKEIDNVFSIYIIPKNLDIAKENLKQRNLDKKQENLRLKEIDEQTKEFNKNKELRRQFDYILYNNYDEDSINKIIEVIKNKEEFL